MTDLDREQMVKTFGKEAADFVELAASLGWKVIVNNTRTSIALVSDLTPKKIHLSSRHKGGGLMRKYAKTLAKGASNNAVLGVAELQRSGLPISVQREIVQMVGKVAMAGEDAVTVLPEEKPKERHVKPAAKRIEKKAEEKVVRERHIVSERPHLMHKRLGKSYPSKTTLERRWSDGVIDYACAVPTCDSTSDSHLSFRGAHWAMHVRKGEAEPYNEREAAASVVDDPTYTQHAWSRKAEARQERKNAIANMLKGINLAEISPEDLAEQIMEFLGDTSGGGGGLAAPLTDAEVLDRIRSLVDRGTYADQEKAIIERDQQIEELLSYSEQREQELERRALEAEQARVKAEAHLQALKELINEEVGP